MRKTANNLMIGFLRESQTSIRYDLYSETAKKEKFILISRTFKEFAIQEKEHANWFYQMIQQLKKEELFENITVEISGWSVDIVPCCVAIILGSIMIDIKKEKESVSADGSIKGK